MIKCKICESEILGERLKDHSSKCRDVTELKENLFVFVNKMESYAEKASAMKNSLETYAAKQMYTIPIFILTLDRKVNKKISRSNSITATIDPGSPMSYRESKDYKDSTPSMLSVSALVSFGIFVDFCLGNMSFHTSLSYMIEPLYVIVKRK